MDDALREGTPPELLCDVEDCYDTALPYFDFCETHKCEKPSCKNLQLDVGMLCAEHKCAVSWCYNGLWGTSVHCEKHKCGIVGCAERSWDHPFCEKHRCIERECTNPGKTGEKEDVRNYCVMHACAEPWCIRKNIVGSVYCGTHGPWVALGRADPIVRAPRDHGDTEKDPDGKKDT